jgi:hypothetical protein
MKAVKPELVSLALLLCAALAFPADKVGEIVYLEDGVELTRDQSVIPYQEVFMGLELENLDLITTDRTGYAELELGGAGSPSATLKVTPGTTFCLELSSLGRDRATSIGMITGSLSAKVAKLSGRQKLELSTESALMAVRGTEFTVTLSPAGDMLLSASEGRVSCVDESGAELFAAPGQVVEKRPGELFREVPVALSSLQTFRQEWYAERLSVFKANALKAISSYALRYLNAKGRFDSAYAGLQQETEVLQKWYAEDRRGQMGSRLELLREKKRIIGHLLELRKVLFIFERIYFRLAELEGYFEQGYGRGNIQAGLSSAGFFQRFDAEKRELARKMAEVRYVTKLYAARNEGVFPTDRAEEGEEDFFGDSSGFFGTD